MMKRGPTFIAIVAIWLALLACRPVFAIGWTELLILIVIIAVLLGPVLLKVYRLLEKIRKAEDDAKKK